jgi:hypothetical protein
MTNTGHAWQWPDSERHEHPASALPRVRGNHPVR